MLKSCLGCDSGYSIVCGLKFSKQLEPPSPLSGCCQLPSALGRPAAAGLQSSRLKQFGFVLCKRKYCHWNGSTWRCSVAIPLAHKSTQVPTPQLIYFCPGKSSDSPALAAPASLPAYGVRSSSSSRSRGKHLPKIFNRHLCTTIPVAIRCRLASPCLLFLLYLCMCVCVLCIYIYSLFCTFIKFSSGIRSRISTASLLTAAFVVFFFCYFPAKTKAKKFLCQFPV